MRKLVGVLVAGAFLVGFAGAASADDNGEGPHFTFGASTSFAYDINDPDDDNDSSANALSYANMEARDESFNIDLVQLGVHGARGRASYAAKIDFGDLTPLAGDSADGDIALQTASLTYDFDGAAITAGRFDTPIGYEVLEPWGNANISRSFSWSLLQPINHDGVYVSGSAGIVDAMLGAVNGFTVSDASDPFNDLDDDKGVVGAVGVGIMDELNLYVSSIYTQDEDRVDRQAYNAIISGNVDMGGSGVRYAVEGNYRNDEKDKPTAGTNVGSGTGEIDWWSIVVYGGADFGPTSLDIRWEYFDVDTELGSSASTPVPGDPVSDPFFGNQLNNFGASFEDQVWSLTVTAGWHLTDGLQFRLEYRHDDADDSTPFADNTNFDDSLDVVQAQVVWYPEL